MASTLSTAELFQCVYGGLGSHERWHPSSSPLQMHDYGISSMEWSHSGKFMLSGDEGGHIFYWNAMFERLVGAVASSPSLLCAFILTGLVGWWLCSM